MLALLHRYHRLGPRPAQTPRELGLLAEEQLLRHSSTAAMAGLPMEIVHFLYRVRFGGHDPDPLESQRLERRIADLEEALRETVAG
jgi:hypothetical protein